MIDGVEAVRGTGSALQLLREHLHLRSTVRLIYSASAECYFLKLDDVDRFQNKRVGMLQTMSTKPFRAREIFSHGIASWTPDDIARVVAPQKVKVLIELGLVSPKA